MKGIIDIHNHILFGVDDGADTIEQSLELLKCEYSQGVDNVILTPHFDPGEYTVEPEAIKDNFEKLKKKANEVIPDMTIHIGNEIMSCNDAVELLNSERIFTMAGTKYVLIEFYPTVRYLLLEQEINRLINNGYVPIIAHCERYGCLRNNFKGINKKNLEHLVEMGAYMQVNVTSVFGKEHKFVDQLIQNDLLHLVASDAHNMERRGIFWNECISYLDRKYEREYIDWLLIQNPKKILSDQYISWEG